jgi:crossover junction endodeoxyribonuclease RuvC
MSGALALYDPSTGWLEVHDCPVAQVNGKSEMFLPGVIDILRSVKVKACVIERSQAMPKQGVSSVFSYGAGYGAYLGVLAALGIQYTRITPQEWKRKLRVPSDKDGARARASELLPSHTGWWLRKKDHGRAEAALLAYYGSLDGRV